MKVLVEVESPQVKLDDLIVPIELIELVKLRFELVELFEQGVEPMKLAELSEGGSSGPSQRSGTLRRRRDGMYISEASSRLFEPVEHKPIETLEPFVEPVRPSEWVEPPPTLVLLERTSHNADVHHEPSGC